MHRSTTNMSSKSPSHRFVYDPVPPGRSIRLFQILPEEGANQLHLSMRSYPLKSRSHTSNGNSTLYMAVSYAWDDANDTVLVSCNGREMYITRSLYGALWRLRVKGYRGQVWADAICINQKDVPEKTMQIRMMGDIYRKAERVYIWLGEEEKNDVAGLGVMLYIYASLKHEALSITVQPTSDIFSEERRYSKVPPECWDGLYSIMRRPWFWRAWVVPEYLLARKPVFQCGRFEIPVELLSSVFRRINSYDPLKSVVLFNINDEAAADTTDSYLGPLLGFEGIVPGATPLLGLLSRTRSLRSSDPKDRLFALVGLSSDTQPSFIDYDHDVGELLRKIWKEKMKIDLYSPDPSVIFQGFAWVSKHDCTEGRSSWAPFFEHPWSFRSLHGLFVPERTLNTIPEFMLTDCKHLMTKGHIFDFVRIIMDDDLWVKSPSTALSYGMTIAQVLAATNRMVRTYSRYWEVLSSLGQYPTGEALPEVFWRSLICDTQNLYTKASPEMAENFRPFLEMRELIGNFHDHVGSKEQSHVVEVRAVGNSIADSKNSVPTLRWSPSVETNIDEWKLLKEYADAQGAQMYRWETAQTLFVFGRKYFSSELGYVGWLPEHAQEGDSICAFAGSRLPFVIRPYQDGFRLIGACYMHGIMEGEAYELPDKRDNGEKFICLI